MSRRSFIRKIRKLGFISWKLDGRVSICEQEYDDIGESYLLVHIYMDSVSIYKVTPTAVSSFKNLGFAKLYSDAYETIYNYCEKNRKPSLSNEEILKKLGFISRIDEFESIHYRTYNGSIRSTVFPNHHIYEKLNSTNKKFKIFYNDSKTNTGSYKVKESPTLLGIVKFMKEQEHDDEVTIN